MGDHNGVLEWLSLVVLVWLGALRSRRALVVENLLLRQQLAVALRARPRPRLRRRDRLFWVVMQRLCAGWRGHLVLVRPETVLGWHRRGWQLFWRWRSRRPVGRPPLPQEVRALIRRLSEENRIWGTFLRNHAHAIWAADLFTVRTLTFRTLYVLFFITHGRRELVHLAVTAHPTAAWVWRQLTEATPWGRRPASLIRDRDRVYGADFVLRAKAAGIQTLLTPFRAPKANAIAERVVRTLRRECLDHVLVLNERHLRAVLHEYVAYYNAERPHRSLGLAPPLPMGRRPAVRGTIRSRPVLGGLHHVYRRAA